MDFIDRGEALNLSTGIATTFLKFAKVATSLVGYQPDIIGDESKPSGVKSRVGDTAKQKQFGFEAQISIEQGIKECITYFENIKK
jgi:GDP-L-fucose synthase